ncbi:MAG: kinesin, partial [Mesorhizobium sp.]
LVTGQVEKLAEGRDILRRALEADLQKIAASRGEVDDIIAGHVGKLAEGRDALTRALEDDLSKLADTRKEVDRSLSGHIDQIAARSTDISDAIAADVEKIEQAFSRQTGIIEERAGTMERALSTGVDNVRSVLEKSAVFVAGALREKVMEVTSALHEQADAAFSDADRKIAERAEQTSAALLARAEDIARTFEEADRRLAARAEDTSSALIARAEDTSSAIMAHV